MKIICIALLALCISCNQAIEKKEEETAQSPVATAPAAQPEDSMTIQLRTAVTSIEKQELQQASTIQAMTIENIRHEMISWKEFYWLKKEELAKGLKYSTDKEKTNRAIVYLENMAAQSSDKPVVYKVQFHLNAVLANTTKYDEEHTKFLKEDLSEITIVFP